MHSLFYKPEKLLKILKGYQQNKKKLLANKVELQTIAKKIRWLSYYNTNYVFYLGALD